MSDAAITEDVLWGWLNTARTVFKHDLHMTRVENEVGPGWPDVEGTLLGTQFFIELKCSYRPVNDDTNIRVKFRPKQPPWHRRRLRAGGRIFVLVQVGSGQRDARRYLLPSELIPVIGDGITEEFMGELSLCDGRAAALDIVRMATGPTY